MLKTQFSHFYIFLCIPIYVYAFFLTLGSKDSVLKVFAPRGLIIEVFWVILSLSPEAVKAVNLRALRLRATAARDIKRAEGPLG